MPERKWWKPFLGNDPELEELSLADLLARIARSELDRADGAVGVRGLPLDADGVSNKRQDAAEAALSAIELERSEQRQRRSRGGKERAARQQAATDPFWQPWRDTYQKLVEQGKNRDAISIIENQMILAQAVPPGRDKVPSPATIRRKLTGCN